MGIQKHTEHKIKLKNEFVDRFTQLIQRLGASHKDISRATGRDRKTIESWLNVSESALPDWADLHDLQSYAERKGVVAEFFRLVGARQKHRFRMEVPDRSGTLAAILVRIFQDGGGLVSLTAGLDSDGKKAVIDFTVLLPGSPERLLEDLSSMAEKIEILKVT